MKRQFLNKKQESNYLAIYDEYRRKYTQGYETGYYRLRDQFGDNVGLPYNVISSGDYDPTTITTPLPTLAHTISPATYTVAPFTVGNYQTVGYNDSLVWGIDRYYLFNITSNGNDFKLGFYGGNQPLSFTSTSSTYPPDFYYESSTGSIYMGNVLLKNIGANKTTLMIRIDSNYNFYIGTALNNYWLIGNCLTNMSIINNDTYTIRWGYEVKSNGGSNTTFNLVSGSYSDLPNILTDGISWPNYRLGGVLNSNRMAITDTVDQSNVNFRVYQVLNYSNDVTSLGQRTSFTLRNISGSFDQVVIFIAQNPFSQPTYTRIYDIVTETSLNFLSYDSLTNSYAIPPSQATPSSWPNLNNINGQIYFRIEEDGKIYSSRDQSNAALIGTLSYSKFYIYVCTKGYSGNKTGTLSFIQHDAQAVLANPTLDPSILRAPMIDRTSTLILPNGNTSDTVSMTAGNYYTTSVVDSTPLTYGLNIWYNVDLNNITNNFKIGFYTNTLINNHTQTSSSVNPPAFYYNTSDRGVYMGGVLKKTLPNDWTLVFLLLDQSLNFYVGYSDVFYYLIDNLNNYLPNIWPNTYTIRLGWEVHANTTSSYTINHIDGGYYQDPSYSLLWPNQRIYSLLLNDYTDQAVITNTANKYTFMNFYTLSNTFSPQGSYTLKNLNASTNTDVIIVIYSTVPISNNSNYVNYTTALTGNYLIYKLSTNTYIKDGVSLGFPTSYPDLASANGQIYVEYISGNVKSSRDSSNKATITSLPVGTLYGGIFTIDTSASNSTFKFIPNNTQAIVPPPTPPTPPLQAFPSVPIGYTNTLHPMITDTTTFSAVIGSEYLCLARPSYPVGYQVGYIWGMQSFFYGTIDPSVSSYKLGVLFKSSVLRKYNDLSNTWGFLNSANDNFYIYYDSLSGNVYVDSIATYNIGVGLTSIGIGVDYTFNVYFATSPTTTYLVGNISSQQLSTSKLSYEPLMSVLAKFSSTGSHNPFTPNLTYTYASFPSTYPEDNISNKLLFNTSLQAYTNETTVSSSSSTSYVFCGITNILTSNLNATNRRIALQCTNATGISDIVIAFARNHTFIEGNEYSLPSIQSSSSGSFGIVTYVQSAQSFFANSTNKYSKNLNLNVLNQTALFDITKGSTAIMKAGADISSLQTITGLYSSPLGDFGSDSFPFIGIFVATATPVSEVKYKIIVPQ